MGKNKKILSLLLVMLLVFGVVAPAGAVEPKKALQDYFIESMTRDTADVYSAMSKGQLRIEKIAFNPQKNGKTDSFSEALTEHLNNSVLDYNISFDIKNRKARVSLLFSNSRLKLPLIFYIMEKQLIVDLDSLRKSVAQIDPEIAAQLPADRQYLVNTSKDEEELFTFWNDLEKAQKDSKLDAKSQEAVADMIGLLVTSLPDKTVKVFDQQDVGVQIRHDDLLPLLSSLIQVVAENPDKVSKFYNNWKNRSSLPVQNASIDESLNPADVKKSLEELRKEMDRSFHLNEYTLIKGPKEGNRFRSLNRIDIEIFDNGDRSTGGQFCIELENWDENNPTFDFSFPTLTDSNQITFEELDRQSAKKR
ncbi:hypothetical protein GTO89_04770 [Heliobacterium gestii]|uniref:Uncharacterized protein n=1 Tax=Heliomicrobium gestii TaxID=2699 RepID=A0A845LFT1_HELGE|nr:hypothetical protein [Heliomicrobium gestii]MBM7866930.1 hypothetical protein [Heliomicrobium gestii]MZP42353.1 hypothetical protein [Heliomicrobium gestii]